MTFGINTSPLSGLDGSLLTSRQIQDRLHRNSLGNVSLRVLETDRAPEQFKVRGAANCTWRS